MDQSCPSLILNNVNPYKQDNETFFCTLNQADVEQNANKFYIMQLLERKDKGCYFILTRSGRVGYAGTDNIDCFLFKEPAVTKYLHTFYEKTGLKWDQRYTADPVEDKYTYIIMDYEEKKELLDAPLEPTVRLDKAVCKLVEMIFDKDNYQKLQEEFRLDQKRAPLGAISKKQIAKANKILTFLQDHLDKTKNPNEKIIAKATSEYYSCIPTSYGMSKPPMLDNIQSIHNIADLLDSLTNVDVMAKMLKNTSSHTSILYDKLGCQIESISPADPMYTIINNYMTIGAGSHYHLKLKELYSISRPVEETKFQPWEALHNRKLLWHGSRTVNFPGILSEGLRINSGATTTGAMFGNGLYFANCSTKSAQYMRVSGSGLGIMILCDVALGNTYDCLQSNSSLNAKKLPTGKHSTWGQGKLTPTLHTYINRPEGYTIPFGSLTDSGKQSSLQYDEFIVYNASQIKIRYLAVVQT